MTNQDIELSAYKYSFDVFVRSMKEKIEKKKEKYGDFTQGNKSGFLQGLQCEYRELMESIGENKSDFDIAKECIDVANLAYMLYWSYMKGYLQFSRM
jgi:DNA replication protein DnaD